MSPLYRTIRATRETVVRQPLARLADTYHWDVVFGRVRQHQRLALATGQICFEPGDLVAVVGIA